MASSISPLMQTAGTSAGTSNADSDPTSKLANEQTFLQLLVAQIKNQNPLNPTDGVQFMTQLAQFSSLEQNVQMSQDLGAIRKLLEAQAAPATSDTTDGTKTKGA